MRWVASEDDTLWDLRWTAFERTAAGMLGTERRILVPRAVNAV